MPSRSLYLARAGPVGLGRPRKPSTPKPSSTIHSSWRRPRRLHDGGGVLARGGDLGGFTTAVACLLVAATSAASPRRRSATAEEDDGHVSGVLLVATKQGHGAEHGPTGLPLILCSVCQEYEVVERVSNTKANPRKRFFKCPRNEPNMPGKSTFFMWLERYQAHLIETGQLSMGNTYPEDAISELFELSDKVREDVKSLKEEMTKLKESLADMKMGRQNLGGVEIVKFVCVVNVVLVVLLVMVLLFK